MKIILKNHHLDLIKDEVNKLNDFNLKMILYHHFFEDDSDTISIMIKYKFFLFEGKERFGKLEAIYEFVIPVINQNYDQEKILHECLVENAGNIQVLIKSLKTGKVIGIVSGEEIDENYYLEGQMPYMIPIQHLDKIIKK